MRKLVNSSHILYNTYNSCTILIKGRLGQREWDESKGISYFFLILPSKSCKDNCYVTRICHIIFPVSLKPCESTDLEQKYFSTDILGIS